MTSDYSNEKNNSIQQNNEKESIKSEDTLPSQQLVNPFILPEDQKVEKNEVMSPNGYLENDCSGEQEEDEDCDQGEDSCDDYGRSGEKYGWYNGFSDDVIDDAFEGDPEATWNVD